MLRTSVQPCVVAALLIITGSDCEKHSGEAVVLAKEHIDAALPNAETPNMSRTGGQSTARPTRTRAESPLGPDVQIRPMADDEIDVEAYVMTPEVRGTSRDPRAFHHEQWIVKVRMLDSSRTFQVPADQAKWENLRENDRLKVRYRTGKYTGTVLGPLRLSENSAHAKLPLLAG